MVMVCDPLIMLMTLMMMMIPVHSKECRTWRGERGRCIDIKRCPEIQQLLRDAETSPGSSTVNRLRNSSICEIGGGSVSVCCKEDTGAVLRDAALLPSSCGRTILTDQIVRGVNASLFSWPWMALLRGRNVRGSRWVCGGVLISERYVLTAAHCVHSSSRSLLQFVRLGEHTLSTNPDCERRVCAPRPQDIPIEEITIHEGYANTPRCLRCHDIALIRLSRPAQLHPAHIVPICLPLELEKNLNIYNQDFSTSFAWAAGWGAVDPRTGAQADVLQEAFLPLNKQYCDLSFYPDPSMVLCAGGEGPDSCGGDSGGPLVMVNPSTSRNYVIGLVSHGPTACGAPRTQGIYTSVSYYMKWILDHLRL